MEVSWSVPHVSQGRGPEETDGGMAINQLVLGGGPRANNVAANGGGGCLILLKSVYLNHANITSVVSETCWPPLNSEFDFLTFVFMAFFLYGNLLKPKCTVRKKAHNARCPWWIVQFFVGRRMKFCDSLI